MYWKTPFRVNKSVDSPISTIRIDVDTLREAYLEVLFLHRLAIILDHLEGDGEVRRFELSSVGFKLI